jgi:PAS domain S-box-containing protein
MFDTTAQPQTFSLQAAGEQNYSFEGAEGGRHSFIRNMDEVITQKEEAILPAYHQPLESLLESIELGLWCYELPVNRLVWNNACRRHFGLSPDTEITIDLFYELLHPDDRAITRQAMERSIAENSIYEMDYRAIGMDNQIRWIHATGRCFYDDHNSPRYFDCIMIDITERKRVEQMLREQTDLLKELEMRKDEFISMASHELKTPITSIKGYTQMLQSRYKKAGDGQSLYYLSIINGQLNKLIDLVNDMLDISRMQIGKLNFRDALFDLNAVVREAVENLQATTHTHQLSMESTVSVQVFGDKDRIGQVLINLLTNAIKYSPRANKVLVRISADQEYATVRVQDFGIGIDEAHQQKIFERFYQVHDTAEKGASGLGIGLYISNQIIKRHEGWMKVESKRGEGSTFSFTLPLFRREVPG